EHEPADRPQYPQGPMASREGRTANSRRQPLQNPAATDVRRDPFRWRSEVRHVRHPVLQAEAGNADGVARAIGRPLRRTSASRSAGARNSSIWTHIWRTQSVTWETACMAGTMLS